MEIKKTPDGIWKEYQKGNDFNTQIDLYDTVDTNQKFYLGMQWEGVNAPDIEKPVMNIVRQATDYFVSMLVSDDIAVSCDLPDTMAPDVKQAVEFITTEGIDEVFENTKFKQNTRFFIKDVALNGDAYFHWFYNTNKNTDGVYIGAIDLELLDNTNVIFGNPAEHNPNNQPYILVISKKPVSEVRDMVKSEDDKRLITADSVDYRSSEAESRTIQDYATVITKLWRENGTIHFMKTAQRVVLVKEVDSGQKIYPVVRMPWKAIKNNYHGASPITEVIPNQIMINKYYMMLNEFTKKMSFPKLLFDQTKIKKWTNKVEAIGVNGDPREAIAVSSPTVEMSRQTIEFIQNLIEQTKATLGIYDVNLGNVRPENTSAIIALQKTASQPLELQRLDYLQVVEDSVRIIVDIMRSFYGVREVPFKTEMGDGIMPFDFSDMNFDDFSMTVEVGSASYWSEITQIQSLDNMFRSGIIPDAITYLEQMPNGIVKNKSDIITAIQQQQAQQMMMAQQQLAMQQQQTTPRTNNSVPTGGIIK